MVIFHQIFLFMFCSLNNLSHPNIRKTLVVLHFLRLKQLFTLKFNVCGVKKDLFFRNYCFTFISGWLHSCLPKWKPELSLTCHHFLPSWQCDRQRQAVLENNHKSPADTQQDQGKWLPRTIPGFTITNYRFQASQGNLKWGDRNERLSKPNYRNHLIVSSGSLHRRPGMAVSTTHKKVTFHGRQFLWLPKKTLTST